MIRTKYRNAEEIARNASGCLLYLWLVPNVLGNAEMQKARRNTEGSVGLLMARGMLVLTGSLEMPRKYRGRRLVVYGMCGTNYGSAEKIRRKASVVVDRICGSYLVPTLMGKLGIPRKHQGKKRPGILFLPQLRYQEPKKAFTRRLSYV